MYVFDIHSLQSLHIYTLESLRKLSVRVKVTEQNCKSITTIATFKIFNINYRDMLPLPNKTQQNYKVFIYRLNNPDLDLFNFVDAVKTFFMLADTRLTEDNDIPTGEIPIFDSANVSLKFISKINLSALRKYMIYTQVCHKYLLKMVCCLIC